MRELAALRPPSEEERKKILTLHGAVDSPEKGRFADREAKAGHDDGALVTELSIPIVRQQAELPEVNPGYAQSLSHYCGMMEAISPGSSGGRGNPLTRWRT